MNKTVILQTIGLFLLNLSLARAAFVNPTVTDPVNGATADGDGVLK